MSDENQQELIIKFQQYQQQLQTLSVQKQTLQVQKAEIENALKELSKVENENVYEIIGNILINRKPTELKEILQDKKERTTLRIESIDKQISRINNKLKEIQQKLLGGKKGD